MNAATKWIALVAITHAAACVGAEPAEPEQWVLDDPDQRDEEVEDQGPDDGPVEQPQDPVDDPVVVPKPTGITCVSEFVSHDGGHYRVRLEPVVDAEDPHVTVERRTYPVGLDMEQLGEATTELMFDEESGVDASIEGFDGVRTERFSIALETEMRPGIWTARMTPLNPHADRLVGEEGTVPATCWRDDLEMLATYVDGECVDADGEPGMNVVDFRYVHATGDGECATLSDERLNGEAYGYPVFEGLDLRGADLSGARLNFASLIDTRLEGTKMGGFSFGYAIVDGSVDEHTELPVESFCVDEEEVAAGEFRCKQ